MRDFMSEQEAKELICTIGRKMYQRNFVAANDGNISIRVGEREAIITPTGVSKSDLTPDMLSKVDFDGNVLEGTWKPTSEVPMHMRIYREDDTIMSTAHAHPCFLTVFANLGVDLDMALSGPTGANPGKVPVIPYEDPGSPELAECVGPYVKDYRAVLLANHGPITWGRSPLEAWHTLEEAEAYARMALIHKFIIGSYRPITREQLQLLADTHGLEISPKRFVNCPETSNNREPGVSLDTYEGGGLRLSDESITRIVDRLAEKLGTK